MFESFESADLLSVKIAGLTMADVASALQSSALPPRQTTSISPLALGAWEAVTPWEHDQQTWMAMDGYLYCIISTDHNPSPAGDRATFLLTYPRPDGLYEHIYGPSERLQKALIELKS